MFLLQEFNDQTSIVEESKDGKKACYIEGVFMQGNIVNGNRRSYPTSVLQEALDVYQEQMIVPGRALGELNHPTPPRPNINPKEVCIKIEDMSREGNDFLGRAKITSTPNGNLIRGLIMEDQVQLGVSSRALTKMVNRNGVKIAQRGMRICTAADVVLDPSAPKAFVDGVMEEREWAVENGVLVAKDVEIIQETVKKTRGKDLLAVYQHIFNEFVSKK